jgi:hypothetical protein
MKGASTKSPRNTLFGDTDRNIDQRAASLHSQFPQARPSGATQQEQLFPSSSGTQNQPALQPSMPLNVRVDALVEGHSTGPGLLATAMAER